MTVAILSLVDVNDLSAIMNYASTRMYADNTNLTFVACSMPELQHDMKVDLRYRKIPKISPGAHIFQRPFLRGLYSEGLSMEGKFALQNRLGSSYSWKEINLFCFVSLCI